jgi:hypothetical protein
MAGLLCEDSFYSLLSINIFGCILVALAYICLIYSEVNRESDDDPFIRKTGAFHVYTTSRFWLKIDKDTALALIPLQLLAVCSFIYLTVYILLKVKDDEQPLNKGIHPHKIYRSPFIDFIYILFYIGAFMWPISTSLYFDTKTTLPCVAVSVSLILCAVAAILLIAGAFEANAPFHVVYASLCFGSVVILADGIGWLARLICSHLKYTTD